MVISRLTFGLLAGALLLPVACDDGDGGSADGGDGDRGHIGKADLTGSCEGACGGMSDGSCWCDDLCAGFGDCCADKGDVCGEAGCAGENPAGCVETGCGSSDLVCVTGTAECVPSACECEAATGTWACTPDCGGGVCVSDDGGVCPGENPAGCAEDGCAAGEVCATDTAECVPSVCECEASTGTWLCTPDCGGGVCVPEEPGNACEGDNPAGCVSTGCAAGEMCATDTGACVPSACFCEESTGTWACTPDCGGGECVAASACVGTNPAEICSEDPAACIPSACECDEVLGLWACTPDCSGGQPC